MVAVKKPKTSIDDTGTLLSDVASFASSIGLGGPAADSSGFNDSDFRKVGPIKSASKLASSTQKNLAGKKFNVKNRETNTFGNRKPAPNRKQETRRSDSVAQIYDFRKVGPIKSASKVPSGTQKDLSGKKFNVNNRETNTFGNRKPAPNREQDMRRSDSVAQIDDERFKNLPKLALVKASALGVWHQDAAEQEEKVIGKNNGIEYSSVEQWKALVEKKKELGERLLAQYVKDYWSSRGQNGDIKMLVATQRSGTAADKVSALSVLIGDNPVANLRSIDSLLGLVTSKVGKRHAFSAFGSLKEIFIIVLPDRKLKTLFQRPLNRLPENKDGYSLLLFWYWEECLKNRYEQFVSALQGASLDAIVELKSLALKTIFTLLKSKSEQERRLLSSLVNKLGDPENKVASNADYHLANLLAEHPNMKAVVIDEVDNFLFRPHLGLRGKYHAVNFLSQIRLSHQGDGPKAAKRLIDIYFALFKVLISENGAAPSVEKYDKKGSRSLKEDKLKASSESHVVMDSRLLSTILTGVNRAFPYLHGDEADEVVQAQTPLLFQMVHSENFNVGVQALMLLDKISSKNQIASDRFYRALYSKLLLPAAMNSSKEEMFIALILRAMKNDVNIKRVAAFSKRLLQVALQLPPQYACGFLFLLSEVLKARPPLWNMMLQSGTAAEDEDLEHFEDITENDDKQASPAPDNVENEANNVGIKAGPNDDNDSLPDENSSATSDSEAYGLDEDDDLLGNGGLLADEEIKSASDNETQNLLDQKPHRGYDLRHREPSYCNADQVGWWELTVLGSHVHPSVAAMAKTLLSGVNIVYDGNPLADLSLVAFLDKFMEKKPKQSTWHGASQIEPAKQLDMNHHLIGAGILSLAEADVPPEDVVFHKFYMNKMNSSKKPKKKKQKKTAEDEATEELYAVDGDEDLSDDEEIDNLLDNSNPSLVAAGDYDYDDLDNIANEDDEDLIADGSDQEVDAPSDVDIAEFDDTEDGLGKDEDDGDEDDIAIGDADDGSDLEESSGRRHKKRKSGASPFARLEDYKHLMENDAPGPGSDSSPKKKRRKSRKVNHSLYGVSISWYRQTKSFDKRCMEINTVYNFGRKF